MVNGTFGVVSKVAMHGFLGSQLMTVRNMLFSLSISLFSLSLIHIAPVGGYCSVPGDCNCVSGYTGPNCTEGLSASHTR